jgi:hypothetical protein
MIPILRGLDADAAPDVVDDELLVLLLLLPPQAAIHSPHSATTPITGSRRSDHRLISLSNFVTS